MIGERVRSLRTGLGYSLRALAAETGLSAPLLSQIERGQTDPSLSTLRKLAKVFGADLPTLLAEDKPQGAHVSKPGSRTLLSSDRASVTYERLTPGLTDLEVLKGRLEPGQASSPEPWGHPSTECSVVLEGSLTVDVDGTLYRLSQGESITFDARSPHRYINESDHATEYLMSCTPPNP